MKKIFFILFLLIPASTAIAQDAGVAESKPSEIKIDRNDVKNAIEDFDALCQKGTKEFCEFLPCYRDKDPVGCLKKLYDGDWEKFWQHFSTGYAQSLAQDCSNGVPYACILQKCEDHPFREDCLDLSFSWDALPESKTWKVYRVGPGAKWFNVVCNIVKPYPRVDVRIVLEGGTYHIYEFSSRIFYRLDPDGFATFTEAVESCVQMAGEDKKVRGLKKIEPAPDHQEETP